MKTSELLEKAAEVAERLDHCKGGLFERDPETYVPMACCALGALDIAARACDPLVLVSVWTHAERVLRTYVTGDAHSSVGTWNDQPHITKEDVVQALRGAAGNERIQEMACSLP